jgi:hypothetical protein
MSISKNENSNIFLIEITPFPTFPQGGRSSIRGFPPWGKRERGSFKIKWKYLDIGIVRLVILVIMLFVFD